MKKLVEAKPEAGANKNLQKNTQKMDVEESLLFLGALSRWPISSSSAEFAKNLY